VGLACGRIDIPPSFPHCNEHKAKKIAVHQMDFIVEVRIIWLISTFIFDTMKEELSCKMEAITRMSLPQLIISIPLLFVLFFGMGFILNMILKTTWLPLVIFLGVVLYVGRGVTDIFTVVNMVLFLSGLTGAITGIWTIRTLRVKGYGMF
jgi:hypothetical protein